MSTVFTIFFPNRVHTTAGTPAPQAGMDGCACCERRCRATGAGTLARALDFVGTWEQKYTYLGRYIRAGKGHGFVWYILLEDLMFSCLVGLPRGLID